MSILKGKAPMCQWIGILFPLIWLLLNSPDSLGRSLAAELPKGSIIAFLPDRESKDYSDTNSLKKWLAKQGWAICDGTNGTPDLNYRMLLGTSHPRNAGQSIGSRSHTHRIRGETGIARGRQRVFRDGIRQQVRVPGEGHKHTLNSTTERAENLPLSTQVLFILKVR